MFKEFGKKAKALGVVVASTVVTTASQAAVTYDSATGFGGDIDLTAYYSAIPIAITVIGVTIATTLGINALRKSR
jgi:hypothetical protein